MKTFFTILTALVAAAAASTLPAEEIIPNGNVTSIETYPNGLPDGLYPGIAARDVDLQKRADSGVYMCNDRNFKGYCVHLTSPFYRCSKFAIKSVATILTHPYHRARTYREG